VLIDANSLPLQNLVEIKNVDKLLASADFSCSDLIVENVSGVISGDHLSSCAGEGNLTLILSQLSVIDMPDLVRLRIEGSSASELNAKASVVNILNSTLTHIQLMNATTTIQMNFSTINEISTLFARGDLAVNNCRINNVSPQFTLFKHFPDLCCNNHRFVRRFNESSNALVLLYPQINDFVIENNGDNIIENSTLANLLHSRSLWLKGGNLTLRNVIIEQASPASIYIDKNGKLFLQNVTFQEENYGIISSAGKHQVSLLNLIITNLSQIATCATCIASLLYSGHAACKTCRIFQVPIYSF